MEKLTVHQKVAQPINKILITQANYNNACDVGSGSQGVQEPSHSLTKLPHPNV